MDKQFIMGYADGLQRRPASEIEMTEVTPGLRLRLLGVAIQKAFLFYSNYFGVSVDTSDVASLAMAYEAVFVDAVEQNLLEERGILEKDHLNLWCLAKVLQPKMYIESGVFIGSSLHALLSASGVEQAVGIDPNLTKLRIRPDLLQGVQLIDDQDFSQLDFQNVASPHLVFFDDHINAARRIIEAYIKGFKVLLFDDAMGMEGMCQRLYPAAPTIPMIANCELLSVGDRISWSSDLPLDERIENSGGQGPAGDAGASNSPDRPTVIRTTLEITQELLVLCQKAKGLIQKVEKLPELGDFVYQRRPENSMDSTKYLVVLKDRGEPS